MTRGAASVELGQCSRQRGQGRPRGSSAWSGAQGSSVEYGVNQGGTAQRGETDPRPERRSRKASQSRGRVRGVPSRWPDAGS